MLAPFSLPFISEPKYTYIEATKTPPSGSLVPVKAAAPIQARGQA